MLYKNVFNLTFEKISYKKSIKLFKIKLLSNKKKTIQLYKTKITMSKKLANITIKPINKPTFLKTLITKVNIKK